MNITLLEETTRRDGRVERMDESPELIYQHVVGLIRQNYVKTVIPK